MKGSNLLFLVSWVILLVVSAAIVLLSAQSLRVAYTGMQDSLTSEYSLTRIGELGGEDAVKAFRGRRATAATWALAFGLLSLVVVWVPYRGGELWAWWALLISMGMSQLLSIVRVIALATTVGAGTSGILLALVLIGLMAGVPRMFRRGSISEL